MHASHEALTLHSPWLTLVARYECLKRHGVGEREGYLGADFSSIVLPKPYGKDNEIVATLHPISRKAKHQPRNVSESNKDDVWLLG